MLGGRQSVSCVMGHGAGTVCMRQPASICISPTHTTARWSASSVFRMPCALPGNSLKPFPAREQKVSEVDALKLFGFIWGIFKVHKID